MISWIREPAERALSAFYHFKASRESIKPTEKHILYYLSRADHEMNTNHLTEYISFNETVSEIMTKYDFIGVQNRFTESMLVLAYRLGLDIEDMLYVKAKDSHHLSVDNKGYPLIPTVPLRDQTQKVQDYLNGEWRAKNAADYELWNAVNKELDQQIANIPHFNEILQRYQCLLDRAQAKCGQLPIHKTDCYLNDQGCGIQCLRSVT